MILCDMNGIGQVPGHVQFDDDTYIKNRQKDEQEHKT